MGVGMGMGTGMRVLRQIETFSEFQVERDFKGGESAKSSSVSMSASEDVERLVVVEQVGMIGVLGRSCTWIETLIDFKSLVVLFALAGGDMYNVVANKEDVSPASVLRPCLPAIMLLFKTDRSLVNCCCRTRTRTNRSVAFPNQTKPDPGLEKLVLFAPVT